MGTYFFIRAFQEWMGYDTDNTQLVTQDNGQTEEATGAQPYELMILGFLLFIPGSYHTWIAMMACCEREGYNYNDVSQFESDEWHNEDF